LAGFLSQLLLRASDKGVLLSLLIRLENLAWFSDLRSSAYVYPVVLALHLTAISWFGAMIVATDLRLLGWALPDTPAAEVIRRLRTGKRIGFVIAAACGFVLFAAKAEEYYYNPFFRAKILLFAMVAIHALVFRSVYTESKDMVNGRAKVAAGLSLGLWLGILCAGRAIGYVVGRAGMHYR
jgi:hypothetical protein